MAVPNCWPTSYERHDGTQVDVGQAGLRVWLPQSRHYVIDILQHGHLRKSPTPMRPGSGIASLQPSVGVASEMGWRTKQTRTSERLSMSAWLQWGWNTTIPNFQDNARIKEKHRNDASSFHVKPEGPL